MSLVIFSIFFILSIVLAPCLLLIDYLKKRPLSRDKQFYSFIIPAHNEQEHIGEVLQAISRLRYKNSEIIVINDCSQDKTLEILNKLSKDIKIKIINNQKNLGKVASLNKAFKLSKGEIVFFIDADTIINQSAFRDVRIRMSDEKVGSVGCAYFPSGNSFLQLMQAIDWGYLYLFLGAHNLYSTISLTGGAMAVRRKAFVQTGGFSLNAITEDIDMALKLNEFGWKVEQSIFDVASDLPYKFKDWYKQKLRWVSGNVQATLKHFKVYLKNPITLSFVFIFAIVALEAPKMLHKIGNYFINGNVTMGIFLFLLFSLLPLLPATLIATRSPKNIYRLFLIFLFCYIYLPVYFINFIHGLFLGVYKFIKLKETDRGW